MNKHSVPSVVPCPTFWKDFPDESLNYINAAPHKHLTRLSDFFLPPHHLSPPLSYPPSAAAAYYGLYLDPPTLQSVGVQVPSRLSLPSMTSSTSIITMTQGIMVYTHYASPIILLVFFLVAFTAHSILTASKEDVVQAQTGQTGPGGKPLPRNSSPMAKAARESKALDFSPSRKLLFIWLSAGGVLTFLGNVVTVIVHALLDRKDHWWCGQAVVVCDAVLLLHLWILADMRPSDLSGCLVLCILSSPDLHCRHEASSNTCSSLYMDRGIRLGSNTLWRFVGTVYLSPP